MKHIAALLFILSLIGCANNNKNALPQNLIQQPTIEFPIDGGKSLTINYTGMPKEIAVQFMNSVYEQRNKFSEYWNTTENQENSIYIQHSCNTNACLYTFSVSIICHGDLSVSFASQGEYPNMNFSYINHGQWFHEDCFVL
jgi:hypothetical protein